MTKKKKSSADYLTYAGAGLLMRRIEKFWKDRGYPLVSVTRYELPGNRGEWGVRSNIRHDGLPPK